MESAIPGVTKPPVDPLSVLPELQKTMFGLSKTMEQVVNFLQESNKAVRKSTDEVKKKEKAEKDRLEKLRKQNENTKTDAEIIEESFKRIEKAQKKTLEEKDFQDEKTYERYVKAQQELFETSIEDSYKEISKMKKRYFSDVDMLNTMEGSRQLKDLLEKETKLIENARKHGLNLTKEKQMLPPEVTKGFWETVGGGIKDRFSSFAKKPLEMLMSPFSKLSGVSSGDLVEKMLSGGKKNEALGGLPSSNKKAAIPKISQNQNPSKSEILKKSNSALGAVGTINAIEKLGKNIKSGGMNGDAGGISALGKAGLVGSIIASVTAIVGPLVGQLVESAKQHIQDMRGDSEVIDKERETFIKARTQQNLETAKKYGNKNYTKEMAISEAAKLYDTSTGDYTNRDTKTISFLNKEMGEGGLGMGWNPVDTLYKNVGKTRAEQSLKGNKLTDKDKMKLLSSAMPGKAGVSGYANDFMAFGADTGKAELAWLRNIIASGSLPSAVDYSKQLASSIKFDGTNVFERRMKDSKDVMSRLNTSFPEFGGLELFYWRHGTDDPVPLLLTNADIKALGSKTKAKMQEPGSPLANLTDPTKLSSLYGEGKGKDLRVNLKMPDDEFFKKIVDEDMQTSTKFLKFHSGKRSFNPSPRNSGYNEYNALLREGERVLNPMENKEYTRYLVNDEMKKLNEGISKSSTTGGGDMLMNELLKVMKALTDKIGNLENKNVISSVTINKYEPESIMNSMGVNR